MNELEQSGIDEFVQCSVPQWLSLLSLDFQIFCLDWHVIIYLPFPGCLCRCPIFVPPITRIANSSTTFLILILIMFLFIDIFCSTTTFTLILCCFLARAAKAKTAPFYIKCILGRSLLDPWRILHSFVYHNG